MTPPAIELPPGPVVAVAGARVPGVVRYPGATRLVASGSAEYGPGVSADLVGAAVATVGLVVIAAIVGRGLSVAAGAGAFPSVRVSGNRPGTETNAAQAARRTSRTNPQTRSFFSALPGGRREGRR